MYWFFLNFRKLSPNILYVHFQVNFSLSSGLFEKLSEAGSGGGGRFLKKHTYVFPGIRNATTWTDGSKVLFQNFRTSYSPRGCPVIQNDGGWETKNCSETRTVLCKRGN
jgi:hypothetical protein